ncbi:MAG: hypothetical protein AAGA30_04135, partial [Planctomycetota bacterium]
MRILIVVILLASIVQPALSDDLVLVEAESFKETGGWLVDQQFIDQMGSPYLLAHGLGVPVEDASTKVSLAVEGNYRIWVRTRDWVATWGAPGAPGKFELIIDGKPLSTTFGTKGEKWHWHDGGVMRLNKEFMLSLHDLTGFEGRCDAILFCRDPEFQPPDGEPLKKLRAQQLGWDLNPSDAGEFDLVVVGGGLAGTSAA